jgi:L-fucose/D-arabinose isomerase
VARIGLISVSDGRESVHADVANAVRDAERRLATALEALGHDVTVAAEIVTSAEIARREGRRIAAGRPDLTVLNLSVWAFPHFSLIAAIEAVGPLLLHSALDPAYPGMVAMLAAGGAFDQLGRRHARTWGRPEEPAVRARLDAVVRAAAAVGSLRGRTFGRIGGRPMGMYTATADPAQWMAQFGVDVEEIDQLELVRRAESVASGPVASARRWLEERLAGVHYDDRQLTPELLERQIRVYYAMRDLIEEGQLGFSGIKAQPELTTHFVTTDVAEAFLNDPYDWDGAKDVHVCSTEADMDAALTMQLLHGISGTPVLFADVRHYHADLDLWDLCNSGQHATWFAARSDEATENLRHVHLYPQSFYFPAGGAAVHHVAAPGEMTFARLTRAAGRYRMHLVTGRFERPEPDLAERLMRASTYEWPHAFARLDVGPDAFLTSYGSNHIHAIPGERVAELAAVAHFLDVDLIRLGDGGRAG